MLVGEVMQTEGVALVDEEPPPVPPVLWPWTSVNVTEALAVYTPPAAVGAPFESVAVRVYVPAGRLTDPEPVMFAVPRLAIVGVIGYDVPVELTSVAPAEETVVKSVPPVVAPEKANDTDVVVLPAGIVKLWLLVGALMAMVGVAAWTTVKVSEAVADTVPPEPFGAPLESVAVSVYVPTPRVTDPLPVRVADPRVAIVGVIGTEVPDPLTSVAPAEVRVL